MRGSQVAPATLFGREQALKRKIRRHFHAPTEKCGLVHSTITRLSFSCAVRVLPPAEAVIPP